MIHARLNESRFSVAEQGAIVCTDHSSLDFGAVLIPVTIPGDHAQHPAFIRSNERPTRETLDAIAEGRRRTLPYDECDCVHCQARYRFVT